MSPRGRAAGAPRPATGGPAASGRPKPLLPASPGEVRAAARRFLTSYVAANGAVIRHDQGGDVVSEGQAYGLVMAELAGRPDVVQRIWSWTRQHLQRPDGLLSWHAAANGQVLDPQAAADADTLAAYALVRYRGAGAAELHAAGRRVAAAVLAHETVRLPSGVPVLTAGPWATGSTAVVNPSYWMPGVFQALARYTGVGEWQQMAGAVVSLVGRLTQGAAELPPDWAKLSGGTAVPVAAPDGSAGVQYGPDAARTPVWFAAGCLAAARALTGGWWHQLSPPGRASALSLSRTGAVLNPAVSPLSLMAAAAAAAASGHLPAARRLVARAAAAAHADPTYYGDAWLALGTALLAGRLAEC